MVIGTKTVTSEKSKFIGLFQPKSKNVVSLRKNKHLFENLICIDVLLTNKCNLRCSYCYEQHDEEHGKFTLETMRKAWDFLVDAGKDAPKELGRGAKKIQFFGGEPMLEKKFILQWMQTNKEEISKQRGNVAISIVTNGLNVNETFIKEYAKYPGCDIQFSLDTLDPKVDDRGLNQKQINLILKNLKNACKHLHEEDVCVRANVTPDNYHLMKEFFNKTYECGARRYFFHPLSQSFMGGVIAWPEEAWNSYRDTIKEIIDEGHDLVEFTIAEGVGTKDRKGQFFGATDLAMDADGDFTTCYVWINQKENLLGNIFKDELYLDTYMQMDTNYERMIKEEEQCRSCDIKNLCYQFASANMATDGVMYRPDVMCQKIAQLYADCEDWKLQYKFKQKFLSMNRALNEEGEVIFSRALVCLAYCYEHKKLPYFDEVIEKVDKTGIDYRNLLGFLGQVADGVMIPFNVDKILERAATCKPEDSKVVYENIVGTMGVPFIDRKVDGVNQDLLYITLLHLAIMSRLSYRHVVAFGGYE